jgi:predicted ArsR family transcriptional regulator
MAVKPLSKLRKVNHRTMAQTIKILLDGPATAHEIAEHTGIHLVTAQEWMRCLRKEGAVHIGGWLADSLGRDVTAVYQIGKGRDKPRHRFTASERQARYREKRRRMATDHAILGISTDA